MPNGAILAIPLSVMPKLFFEQLQADALTVAPYMGLDSVQPFLGFENKWVVLLGLTSNSGSADFQQLKLESGRFLYEEVVSKAISWAGSHQLMFVTGATKPEMIARIRKLAPDYFFFGPRHWCTRRRFECCGRSRIK